MPLPKWLKKENKMAVIEKVEFWWVNVDPKNPVRFKQQKTAPAKWELQIRSTDRADFKAWKDKDQIKEI